MAHQEGLDEQVTADSAGTHAYHVGEPPDRRAQAAASKRGYDLSDIRARRVDENDFYRFDLIIAMDQDNLQQLEGVRPRDADAPVELFLDYAAGAELIDVPDPYYGGLRGFERVLDLVEEASQGLLKELRCRRPGD
jgi:protein-tyrosine phosphatase